MPSHGTTASGTLSLPMGRVAFLQSSSVGGGGGGWGGCLHQLCPRPQLSQCRGPLEITVKFILHISPSWTRWLLAGVADPTRQEALEAKEVYPPTLNAAQGSPTPIPGPTSAFCPKSTHVFSWGDSLLCIRKHPALAFLQAHRDCWLWKVAVAGFHLGPGTP